MDMHCIVLPVKFDSGLSISVLRNKQLLKKMDVKSSHFQKLFPTPPFEERRDLGKSFPFFEAHFSCERDGRPNFKFDMDL
jgi:hypothetical protein